MFVCVCSAINPFCTPCDFDLDEGQTTGSLTHSKARKQLIPYPSFLFTPGCQLFLFCFHLSSSSHYKSIESISHLTAHYHNASDAKAKHQLTTTCYKFTCNIKPLQMCITFFFFQSFTALHPCSFACKQNPGVLITELKDLVITDNKMTSQTNSDTHRHTCFT